MGNLLDFPSCRAVGDEPRVCETARINQLSVGRGWRVICVIADHCPRAGDQKSAKWQSGKPKINNIMIMHIMILKMEHIP